MIERLFVYGTLQPGHANAHRLEALGGTFAPAHVRGILRPRGWTAGQGYPVLMLDPDGERVDGFVFSSARLARHWAELDAFEGSDYARVLATVHCDDGRALQAYVYVRNAAH